MTDIRIAGAPEWNASNYSVTEDSTPIDPSDSSGGVGQFTFSVPETSASKRLRDKTVDLLDGAQGATQGTARGLSGDGTNVNITADSRLAALAVDRTAAPYTGTLEGAFRFYLGLVGLNANIVVDASIATRPVVFPGWDGSVWDQIKKLCAAQQVEVSLAGTIIVLRPLRGRIAENYRDSSRSWAVDSSSIAQTVEVMYYQNVQRSGALAYPLGGWTDDVKIFQVDAGETIVEDIPLIPSNGQLGPGASITSIQQPVAVNWVDRNYDASSVYSISRNDGYPLTAAEWNARGGTVVVGIGEDTRSLTLTITGPTGVDGAPFRLAMAADSETYSSLRLVGTGVFFDKQMLTFHTGNSPDKAPQVVGATVDNEFINTKAEAFKAGLWAAARWTGPKQTITVNTTGINRVGDTGSYRYPTIADFNTQFAGLTIAQFNTLMSGKTIADFNEEQKALVSGDFDNQAFGNVGGARVFDDDQWYRIRTATITPGGVSYTAEGDTTIGDFDAVWAGLTIADFNAAWAGATIADFNTAPLSRAPDYVPTLAYPDLFFPDMIYPA